MRKAFLVILLLNIALISNAQRSYYVKEHRVRLGFRLDPTVSLLVPQESGVDRNAGRLGISFGVMADFMLDDAGHYAFATGLQITTAGSKLKYDAGKGLDDYKANPAEYNIKATYVEVPLALKLKAETAPGMNLFGQFGTYVGFPVRGRADVVSLTQTYDKVNILRDLQPVNIGLLVGAGVEYPISESLTGLVGLDYRNGFIDVTRNAKWNDGKVNMNSIALKLGLFF
ncbi:porin family protein [Chitinophaga sp.]|uniref:porin family protein n=1 Tax=Chitinophaga sp. TaxID=1869181 RepID=UPI0031D3A508